mgnify:CR=1 FL=1
MSTRLLAGRYELIEKIGEGGMAIVYKARCRLLNRYVAIKILRPEFTKDEKFIENFRRESQAAAALTHPNIVSIYDVGEEGNIHFIVMELVEGKTLSQYIEEKGRLDYKEAISITRQVASALSLAHKNQIIHRDIKPHNILITNTGVAKLTDFGIAKAVSASTIIGGAGKVMGSVHYFSPEQARGAYVDERSDIYSLGIVLYEMLTGKVPFDGDNPVTIALMHINEPMPSVTAQVPGIPPQLEKIIMKATEKYQSNRYRTADEMIEDLDNIEFITKVMGRKAFLPDEEPAETAVQLQSAPRRDKNTRIATEDPVTGSVQTEHASEKSVKSMRGGSADEEKAKKVSTAFIIVAGVIVLIAALIGMAIVFDWFGGDAKTIEVPDFAGSTLEEAQQQADELGLKVEKGEEFYSPDQDAGLITTQEPTAGSEVSEGKTIIVNISKGKKDGVMPKVVGKDLDEAKAELEALGFGISLVREVTDSKPKNTIIFQSIEAGQSAPSGTTIEVEVSNGKGKEMVKMPNIIGKTPDEANALLANEGLAAAVPVFEETNEIAQNLVFWQQYPEGTELEKGTEVQYKVSKGEQPDGSGNGTDVIDGDEEDPATDE